MHMLFLCPFSKATWFSSPWYIRTEVLAEHNHSIPQMLKVLLDSAHPHINVTSVYTLSYGVFGKHEMIPCLIENFVNHHRYTRWQMRSYKPQN